MNFSLYLTDNAKKHLQKMTENNKAIYLSVKNSGCSGFKYVTKIIEQDKAEVKKFQNVSFIIDEQDYVALNNIVIDYVKDGLNYKLTFDNPNSMNECGCGESFSLKGFKK